MKDLLTRHSQFVTVLGGIAKLFVGKKPETL